ncbi:MAG: PD-(D/E)XK nuclease-like domain-containing protein [Synergistaceae bacterium]|nr:PD-(D/E)XK nuclease-like domain-containing protein [Synergistaceae bacterium]
MIDESIKTGIYKNISNQDYHAGAGLSSSDLKKLDRSPLHYITSKQEPHVETPSMKLGTAVHCAVLEPERFKLDYIQAPELDKRTKAGKEQWAELEQSGKIILTSDEYQKVIDMSQSVLSHKLAGNLFRGGISEQSFYWHQPVGLDEILCKCRPDYIKSLTGGDLILDLKTTRNSNLKAFQRQAFWELEYYISAAHYMTGYKAVTGYDAQAFIFVAVEIESPYAVSVFRASNDFLTYGEFKCSELYQLYFDCMSGNEWPGYPDEIQDLDLPVSVNF